MRGRVLRSRITWGAAIVLAVAGWAVYLLGPKSTTWYVGVLAVAPLFLLMVLATASDDPGGASDGGAC